MFGAKSKPSSMANLSIISISKFFILKISFPYMSKYENQPLSLALMNFSFASFL